jgi:hypothetical protein
MTDVDRPAFAQTMNRLSVALREKDPDAVQMRVYFEALQPIPIEAVEASALEIAQRGVLDEKTGQRRRGFFPTSAQWYDAAQLAMKDYLRKALPPVRSEPWRYDCVLCDDTGWEYFSCSGDSLCGRTTTHAAHPYVRPCPCRATNPTYQRHHHFGAGE